VWEGGGGWGEWRRMTWGMKTEGGRWWA